jgi:hypothetical protein
MGLLDDIDDEEISANSRLLRTVVPGYDYRSQKSFEATDERLRTKVRRDLIEAKQLLDGVHDGLYDAGRRDEMEQVASVRESIETVQRHVETAQSGGGGARHLVVEDESHIPDLIEHDATLVERSEALVERLEGLSIDSSNLTSELTACEQDARELRGAIRSRRDYLDGLR